MPMVTRGRGADRREAGRGHDSTDCIHHTPRESISKISVSEKSDPTSNSRARRLHISDSNRDSPKKKKRGWGHDDIMQAPHIPDQWRLLRGHLARRLGQV